MRGLLWSCSGGLAVLALQWFARRLGEYIYSRGTLRGRPEDATGFEGEELAAGTYVVTDKEGGAFVRLTWGRTFYTFLRGVGTGRPVLVCVHGLGGESSVFYASNRSRLAEELLGAGYDVLTFDLYGHGFSEGPDLQEYSAELFASQLAELLVRLDLQCKFDLLSHSFGGPITTLFAARFPNRVRRLVLLAPVYGSSMSASQASLLRIFALPVIFRFVVERAKPMGQGANRDNAAWGRTFLNTFRTIVKSEYKTGAAAFNDKRFGGQELLASLPRDISISIISGDHDTDVHVDALRALVKELEGMPVTLDVVEGAGHVTYFDGPDAAEHGAVMRKLVLRRLPRV